MKGSFTVEENGCPLMVLWHDWGEIWEMSLFGLPILYTEDPNVDSASKVRKLVAAEFVCAETLPSHLG